MWETFADICTSDQVVYIVDNWNVSDKTIICLTVGMFLHDTFWHRFVWPKKRVLGQAEALGKK